MARSLSREGIWLNRFLTPKIVPPSFIWTNPSNGEISKVHEWIQPLTNLDDSKKNKKPDIVMVGVPLSRSSISASAASEFPDFFRRAWKGFTTYNLDYDLDLSQMTC